MDIISNCVKEGATILKYLKKQKVKLKELLEEKVRKNESKSDEFVDDFVNMVTNSNTIILKKIYIILYFASLFFLVYSIIRGNFPYKKLFTLIIFLPMFIPRKNLLKITNKKVPVIFNYYFVGNLIIGYKINMGLQNMIGISTSNNKYRTKINIFRGAYLFVATVILILQLGSFFSTLLPTLKSIDPLYLKYIVDIFGNHLELGVEAILKIIVTLILLGYYFKFWKILFINEKSYNKFAKIGKFF